MAETCAVGNGHEPARFYNVQHPTDADSVARSARVESKDPRAMDRAVTVCAPYSKFNWRGIIRVGLPRRLP